MDAQQQGQASERLAQEWLEAKGFVCLHRNWRCKVGEVDLIMMQRGDSGTSDELRVFVEVRFRHHTEYGSPMATVDTRKQHKIIAAARWYQQHESYWGDIRFDVVGVTARGSTRPIVEHVPDAFTA